jgi:hypothetical protein
MTPQEQDMIGGLIDRVQKTNLADKDTDAEQMLQQGLGSNPDSLYILAQTVLVQKYALDQAQAQLSQAKAQMDQMHAQMRQHPDIATYLSMVFRSAWAAVGFCRARCRQLPG